MINDDYIQLNEMLSNLGYEDLKPLNRSVSNILREKEGFFKKYCKVEKKKFYVKKGAERLVDNISILLPYNTFFGRAPAGDGEKRDDGKGDYMAYKILSEGLSKIKPLKKRIEKKEQTYQKLKKSISQNITNLEALKPVLLRHDPVDLEIDSIRELMDKSRKDGVYDFSSAYNLSIIDKIGELKDDLSLSKDINLFNELAESFLEIGEVGEAEEVIDIASDVCQANSVTMAIKAKIAFRRLQEAKREHRTVYYAGDGGYEHPLNSEEFALNDAIDYNRNKVREYHNEFMKSAQEVLNNWPIDMIDKTGRKYDKREAAKDVTKDWLILRLVMEANSEDNVDILLQKSNEKTHNGRLIPEYGYNEGRENFCIKLIQIISWKKPQETKNYLNELLAEYSRCDNFESSKYLDLLRSTTIMNLVIQELGRKRYFEVYSSLERKYEKYNRIQKLTVFCQTYLGKIFDDSQKNIKNMFSDSHFEYPSDKERLEELYNHISGWSELLEFDAWKNGDCWNENGNTYYPGIKPAPERYSDCVFGLILLACFIEVYKGNTSKDIMELLKIFSESDGVRQGIVGYFVHSDYCITTIVKDVVKNIKLSDQIDQQIIDFMESLADKINVDAYYYAED